MVTASLIVAVGFGFSVVPQQRTAGLRAKESDFDWCEDDEALNFLLSRISKAREADETCAANWRQGFMDEKAVVELEDADVSQARLHGTTCAFGTSNGEVLVIDVEECDVVDGYEAHSGQVTALDWDGTTLVTGGEDGLVKVFEPNSAGGCLFEMVDEDVEEEPLDDEPLGPEIVFAPLYKILAPELAPRPALADRALVQPDFTDDFSDIVPEPTPDLSDSMTLHGHEARVTGLCARDGVVYSVGLDKQIIKWDLKSKSGSRIALASSSLCCLAVAGEIAIVGLQDGGLAGYDVTTSDLLFHLPNAHDGAVTAIHVQDDHYSRLDGTRLLATGGVDGVVKCWTLRGDIATLAHHPSPGSPRRTDVLTAHVLKGHTGDIVSVQADDTKLVSASTDGSIRVWCLESGEQLYWINGLSKSVSSVHFDNHLLVSDGTNNAIVVHDFSRPAPEAWEPSHDWGLDDDDGYYTGRYDDDPLRR